LWGKGQSSAVLVQHQRSSKTLKETKLHKNHQNIPIYLKKKGAEKAPKK
jgi:hypothetical protein